jgi:hypothetical protein
MSKTFGSTALTAIILILNRQSIKKQGESSPISLLCRNFEVIDVIQGPHSNNNRFQCCASIIREVMDLIEQPEGDQHCKS